LKTKNKTLKQKQNIRRKLVMKTKNNIQKTALRTVAAATGLAILSFTVNAQGLMKSLFENNEINHIAMVMENSNYNSLASNTFIGSFTNAETYAAYLAPETEETLNVEDWMVNESNFTTMLQIETETESPLEVEDWMTNESKFGAFADMIEPANEEALNLETWMVDENHFTGNENSNTVIETKANAKVFSTSTFFFRDVVTESKLMVEDWMINQAVWGK
jgi:hypothetical protein